MVPECVCSSLFFLRQTPSPYGKKRPSKALKLLTTAQTPVAQLCMFSLALMATSSTHPSLGKADAVAPTFLRGVNEIVAGLLQPLTVGSWCSWVATSSALSL